MEAALLGRLINPYTQNSLDNLFSRTVVARPKDAVPGLPGTADRADLGAAAASPTQVLNQEILDSLDKVLSANGASGLDRNADTDAYSPEKVAERILGFIESVVGQEPDKGKRSELLDQARAGVEKGFAEARDILEGLGVLNGDVAGNVDRTYELIQGGLERLASNGSDDDGDGDEHIESEEGSSAAAATQAGFVASSYSTTQTTSLIVNTLEGDRVTIDITKQATTSRTEIAGAAGSGGFSSVQSSREASVSFNFNVEGDLNEDEQKAIDNLIKRIDKVSDKFFDSNVQAAFNKASNLEFNSEELAGFSLNLSNTQTFRAVAAYQQSQPASAEPETASLGDAAALGGEVRGLIDEAAATTPLAEPARDVANIFNALTSERASAFGFDALKNDAMSALQDLVGRIVDSYKVDREDAHAEEHGEQNDSEVEEAA
ncbi:hypothetical protein MNBD_GAMMA15-913 [hydrothermal vent metagenome]|uniref:DUF5610 domain-containing protein n=1 Tax=hydrothermal vent metagenome TaxID=652676 RepID=A0A3B0YFZ8_9ZZZZ